MRDAKSDARYVIGVCHDITARKNAELALQKSESILRSVTDPSVRTVPVGTQRPASNTLSNHLRSLVVAGSLKKTGERRGTRYSGVADLHSMAAC